jgi:hypothetical protein
MWSTPMSLFAMGSVTENTQLEVGTRDGGETECSGGLGRGRSSSSNLSWSRRSYASSLVVVPLMVISSPLEEEDIIEGLPRRTRI